MGSCGKQVRPSFCSPEVGIPADAEEGSPRGGVDASCGEQAAGLGLFLALGATQRCFWQKLCRRACLLLPSFLSCVALEQSHPQQSLLLWHVRTRLPSPPRPPTRWFERQAIPPSAQVQQTLSVPAAPVPCAEPMADITNPWRCCLRHSQTLTINPSQHERAGPGPVHGTGARRSKEVEAFLAHGHHQRMSLLNCP